jgi:hypothetical protein
VAAIRRNGIRGDTPLVVTRLRADEAVVIAATIDQLDPARQHLFKGWPARSTSILYAAIGQPLFWACRCLRRQTGRLAISGPRGLEGCRRCL